jgi:hypothetical protein
MWFAVFPDVAAEGESPILPPESLEEPGGRTKAGIEWFMDPVFSQDLYWDNR